MNDFNEATKIEVQFSKLKYDSPAFIIEDLLRGGSSFTNAAKNAAIDERF